MSAEGGHGHGHGGSSGGIMSEVANFVMKACGESATDFVAEQIPEDLDKPKQSSHHGHH